MDRFITAAFFFLALCMIARRTNAKLRLEDRLPMQWWINGDVTWSAPRPVALGFVPALALPVFAMLVFLPPRHGQESDVFPATMATGATFIAVQFLHFWLIDKTIKRNGR